MLPQTLEQERFREFRRRKRLEEAKLLWELGLSAYDIGRRLQVAENTVTRWADAGGWVSADEAPDARRPQGGDMAALCARFGYNPGEYMVAIGAVAQDEIEQLEHLITRMDPGGKDYREAQARLKQLQALALEHAKELMPYVHPRLKSTELTGKDGGPIEAINRSMTPEEAARIYFENVRGLVQS